MQQRRNPLTFSPFRFIKPSLKTTCYVLILVLSPQFFMLGITKSYSALILLLCSVCATFLAQSLFSLLSKKKLLIHFECALVEGLLIGMCIPSNYSYLSAFFIIFFGMLISKHLFGEFANAWVNPISIVIIFLFLLGKPFFDEIITKNNFLVPHNLLAQLIVSNAFELFPIETNFFNEFFLTYFDTEFPEGYISLLWDSQSLIPAYRFNLLTIIASLFLFSFDIIDWVIPVCFLSMYGFLIYFFGSIFASGTYEQGDILFALLTSGTLFICFFLLQWYGTTPKSFIGKIIFGVFAGLLTFFINGTGLSAIGSFFIILLINIISPAILFSENFLFLYFNKKLMEMKLS
ncbi:MAG: RnfABCDGE type electron transport complex subunit D [Treponemataceae bacterium]